MVPGSSASVCMFPTFSDSGPLGAHSSGFECEKSDSSDPPTCARRKKIRVFWEVGGAPPQQGPSPRSASLVMLALNFHDFAVQRALGISEMLYGIKHEDAWDHQPYSIQGNKIKPEINGVAQLAMLESVA